MKAKRPANLGASLRARLLNVAEERKEDFQFVLDRWVAERFLYRLGRSSHRNQFILKGASLFLIWEGKLPRPTRDIDFLGIGSAQIKDVTAAIAEICSVPAEDAIEFDVNRMTGEAIREDAEYDGVRVQVPASLDKARSQLQIDIGFGDAVDPIPEEQTFPVMLPMDAPQVKAYPPEVVVAEKFHAMVHLGVANSRMKDFFDIWLLSREQTFMLSRLRRALAATFARRGTLLPTGPPTALTDAFLHDKGKNDQWKAFLNRMRLAKDTADLAEVGQDIARFLMPPIESARAANKNERKWPPKGPWGQPS